MTLYLKYRSQKINDLDLGKVREALNSFLKKDEIPHALLFTGPRGAGKTSAARIIAKVLNCEKNKNGLKEPCNECSQCTSITKGGNVDVVEIDAASHRGIDDIRSLRENIALAPNRARKKVYIIDEVHMLTNEAANAFLKTLEEPPEHVHFILATTNPEKLPETVLSRLTVVNFTKATKDEISRQLGRVMKGEKIEAEDGVVELIAKASDGSFRDSIKLLESLWNGKKITKKDAENQLFQSDVLKTKGLVNALSNKNELEAYEIVEDAVKSGGSCKKMIDSVLDVLHKGILSSVGAKGEKIDGFTKQEMISLSELLIEARSKLAVSPVAQLPLEIAIAKWCAEGERSTSKVKDQVEESLPDKSSNGTKKAAKTQDTMKSNGSKSTKIETPGTNISKENWNSILKIIREKNSSVEALLRASEPILFDGNNLTVGVYYQFHKEQLEVHRNRKILEDVVSEMMDRNVKVSCELRERNQAKKRMSAGEIPLTDSKDEDIIQAAKEIFGG